MNAPTRQPNPIAFRSLEIEAKLAARATSALSAGQIAVRDLDRFYSLLARDLRAVNLTEAEALLIADASNGTIWDASSIPHLDGEIEDSIELDALDAKWLVDGPALVAKLRALTPGQAFAVVDAIERAWNDDGDMAERLRRVGLVRTEIKE